MPDDEELTTAQARIAQLEGEIAALRAQAQDAAFVRELRARLTDAAAAGTLSAPTDHSALLRQTVSAAMTVLNAGAGSLYVVDDKTDELVFQVALPAQAENLVGQRLPLGHGLAGWVAATGQAIGVADVQQDPRWAGDVAIGVGYAPKTMLAAPLLIGDRVIGVIQILDKSGGQPFGAGDLEMLGEFANQGAVAIEQSQRLQSLARLFRDALSGLAGADTRNALGAGADAFVDRLESSREYAETMELARLLGEVSRGDDAARRLCLDVMTAFAGYVSKRAQYGL